MSACPTLSPIERELALVKLGVNVEQRGPHRLWRGPKHLVYVRGRWYSPARLAWYVIKGSWPKYLWSACEYDDCISPKHRSPKHP